MGRGATAVLVGLSMVVAIAAVLLLGRSGSGPAPPPTPPTGVSTSLARPQATARALAASPPVLLEIPRIGVRTTLMRLGKNADGTLEVPPLSRVDEAGWYRLGPSPGSAGPAVIAGHVDSVEGPGVFYRLGELRPGDRVTVLRKDRRRLTFEVDALERVPKDRFPTRKVYGMTTFPGLRLITCGGDFDAEGGHYRDNVIVYAHLVAGRGHSGATSPKRSDPRR